jgi:Ras-related protein Rab-11A
MLDDDNYDLIFKIVLIGDSGVGKTNILSRYINNEFSLATQSTVGVEFGSKIIKKNGKVIKLQIWDTAGQERYKSITSAYYKGSKGAFVVYDITRKTTYDNIDKWIGELKTNGSEDVLIMLVGNKSDLEEKREVITEEVEKKAQEQKLAFCETSALNGKNVEYAFENLINEILKKVEKEKINEAKQLSESKAITLETADRKQNEKDSKNKKKCC